MDFKEQFNSPLPIINKETNNIYIETPGDYDGFITVKNNGGGTIAGSIMSNSRSISFASDFFSGNDSEIAFHIDMAMFKIGDILKTSVIIMSNGGEHNIDFIVKMVPYAIEAKDGIKITGMDEFYNYAVSHPVAARQMFFRHEFLLWLYSSGYEYIDIYEKLASDTNKERAIENFFLFNNYKKRPVIKCGNNSINIKLLPFSKDIYTDSIAILKDGWGYVEEDVSLIGGDWIWIDKDKLQSYDFDDGNIAYINFFIDPAKIEQKLNIGAITIGSEVVSITVVKKSYIEVSLEKKHLKFKDKSFILIKNNSGARLTVDILPGDDFLKFESVRYFVNESAKIPFQVEIPAMRVAQLSLLKQPEINSHIVIDTVYKKQAFEKKLELVVCNY